MSWTWSITNCIIKAPGLFTEVIAGLVKQETVSVYDKYPV